MALIKLPEGQQRSGKQGGMVWSKNRYGTYARDRAIPTNPNTSRQQTVRNAFKDLANRWWSTVTAEERAQWETYCEAVKYINRLGDSVVLTGMTMYIACNVPRVQAGLDPVDAGPVTLYRPVDLGDLTVAVSEATQLLTLTFDNTQAWANEAGGALLVYQTKVISSTRVYRVLPSRYLGKVIGASPTPPTSPQTFALAYTAQALQGMNINFRITRADGRLSSLFRVGCTAAA